VKFNTRYAVVCILLFLVFCGVLCGADYMYWSGNFPAINVAGNITKRSDAVSGSSMTTIYLNVNAQITANNGAASQLTCGTSNLLTEYKLSFDGNGSGSTGGAASGDWSPYNTFLSTPAAITFVPDDNDVKVTLEVRASIIPGQLADAGNYTATQTLTVSWTGP
jgi:hypothetical protein